MNGRLAFLTGCFAWATALGTTYVLIPWAALALGASPAAVGSLLAAPVLVQFGLNLTAGALSDRFGSKVLVLLSSSGLVGAGVSGALAPSLLWLGYAQLCIVVGRAVFWSPAWALATTLPGDKERNLGLVNAITNGGQFVGPVIAGLLSAAVGPRQALWTTGALAAVALLLFTIPRSPAAAAARRIGFLARYARIAASPAPYYGMLCAFLGGAAFSLGFSFLPIYLTSVGFANEPAGTLIGFRAVGAVVFGLVTGHLVFRQVDRRRWVPIGSLLQAVGVVAVTLITWFPADALGIFLLGFGSAVLTLHYQLFVAACSSPADRASFFAFAGMGWGMSHALVPAGIGLATTFTTLAGALQLTGLVVLLLGLIPLALRPAPAPVEVAPPLVPQPK